MKPAVTIMMVAGLVLFFAGAMVAAASDRTVGIALMVSGLIFQVLTLRQLKLAKKKGGSNARG